MLSIEMLSDGIGVIDNIFLETEELIDLAESSNWRSGTAGAGINPNTRITDVHDLDPNSDIHKELLQTVVDGINLYGQKFSQLRITQGEHLRVMRYPEGGFYNEHIDAGPGNDRVLSVVLFLNDDFDGGELEFIRQGLKLRPKAGTMVLFPSNYLFVHKSHPITKGIKYSVVSWFR